MSAPSPPPGIPDRVLRTRRQTALRVSLIALWLLLGALWGLAFGRIAIGSGSVPIGALMALLGEDGHYNTHYLRSFLKLIFLLSVGGNAFWFVRRVTRGTELAYQSFVVLLWVGLLAACALPRMAQESSGVIGLVNTHSAYSILGDAFSSIFRNYMAPFALACAGSATILARLASVAFGKERDEDAKAVS